MALITPTLPSDSARASAAAATLDAANALPIGHRLHEFEVRGVIGVGGFGIVYRAFDHTLEREVAIKEYMPSALAGRSGKYQVSLLSAAHGETFAIGLTSFVNEAKLLARFDHPSLVKVHRFWEDNGTAYMVMPLYRGVTLRAWRQHSDACPDGTWLMRLLDPLLGALEVLHREGVYHRDIAPDNIIVAEGAAPVLLDFGAARRVISDRSQTLTAILKPSYAPLEQYAESTGMRQGPWTDFYALGATLHFLITGKAPMPATARAISDDQPLLAGSGQGGVPDLLLQVCDWMLAARAPDRPQNVAEVRAALAGHLPVPLRERAVSADAWHTTVVQGHDAAAAGAALQRSDMPLPAARAGRRSQARLLWSVAAVMVVVAACGAWWASTHTSSEVAGPGLVMAKAPAPPITGSADNDPPVAASDGALAKAVLVVGSGGPAAGATRPSPTTIAAPSATARSNTSRVSGPGLKVKPVRTRAREQASTPAPTVAPAAEAPAATTTHATTAQGTAPQGGGTAAPESGTAAAPVSVAQATRSPREACAGRHLIAMHRCMVRECVKPDVSAHRECQRVRDIEARARQVGVD